MARVEFTEENRVATTNFDYPKLRLRQGEQARILLLENPNREWVHSLHKPVVINGVASMTLKERKDKSTYETNLMKFVAKSICLGDAGILKDKGSDPRNCPMCKLALEHPEYARPPEYKYAMHVIRYRTKAGSHDLATPFSVELLVWSFSSGVYNKLIGFKEEWDAVAPDGSRRPGLPTHDLLLTCAQETFQTFDISVANKAAWLQSPEWTQLTKETFQENQIPDLAIACGTQKRREWVDQDITAVLEAWAEVHAAEAGSGAVAPGVDLDASLDSLLNTAKAVTKPALDTTPVPDLSVPSITADMVDTDGVLLNDQPTAEVPEEPTTVPAALNSGLGIDNFDDLLKDLNQ